MDTIREILLDVNSDIEKIKMHAGNTYLRNFLSTAFLPSKKLDFPAGVPPYIPAATENDQQVRGAFWQFAKKLDTLRRKDVHKLRLETIFIQSLESVSEEEAKLIIQMKDQTLSETYPNITKESLTKVGYFVE